MATELTGSLSLYRSMQTTHTDTDTHMGTDCHIHWQSMSPVAREEKAFPHSVRTWIIQFYLLALTGSACTLRTESSLST